MSVIIRLASRLAGELSGIAERLPEQHLHAGDSTLVRLINNIIADAYQAKVSDSRHQFAFAPVCLITLPQRWISVRIHSPNCSGVPATISNSTARSLSRTSGELRIFTSSRL